MRKDVKNVIVADILSVNMRIYTRTGDQGLTSIFGGKKVSKADDPIFAYGAIDELSSFLGLLINKIKSKKDKQFFIEIQKDLYQIMAYLSGAKISLDFCQKKVLEFEKKIDNLTTKLPILKKFILPGGTELSCWFHILRTVCRRAERLVVKTKRKLIIPYFNRLSDLFFTYARFYNKEKEIIL